MHISLSSLIKFVEFKLKYKCAPNGQAIHLLQGLTGKAKKF